MKLSEKIPLLVKRQGMKQADLARAIGAHPSRVSEWIAERGNPSVQQALRMARALGVTLDYLADDDQDEPPAKMDEWEEKLLEAARELGPKLAWRRLLGAPEGDLRNIGAVDAGPISPPPERRGSDGWNARPPQKQRRAFSFESEIGLSEDDSSDSERRIGGVEGGPDADASSRRGSA